MKIISSTSSATRRAATAGLAAALLSLAGCSDDDPAPVNGSASTAGSTSGSSGGIGATGGGAQGGTGGQGGSAQGSGGAGAVGGGGGGGDCTTAAVGAGGAIDVDQPCASIVAPRVAWVTKADPEMLLTQEVSLLWAFQYVVALPEKHPDSYTLQHERCETPAGGVETCTSFDLPLGEALCETLYGPKYGIDPSQYQIGENSYTFTMRLFDGCNVVSDDSFTTLITFDPQ